MGNKYMKKEYKYCKSILCKECKNYQKFLSVSTMQMICWNKGRYYCNKYK